MEYVLAISPILLIFLLLFGFKLSSLKASVIALVYTAGVVSFSNRYELQPLESLHAAVRGSLISFIAAYVLLFGILLYHLMNKSGAIDKMAAYLSEAIRERTDQIILLTIGFSPLIESTSGFGIAFMVVAPILRALGFSNYQSVIIGLVSLLAVPWGALSTGTVIGAQLGRIPLDQLGLNSAVLSIPVFVYFLVVAVIIGSKDWKTTLRKKWKHLLLYSVLFGFSNILFNAYVSVEIAGVLSALCTMLTGLALHRMHSDRYATKKAQAELSAGTKTGFRHFIMMFAPYIFLTVVIFCTRLIKPVQDVLHRHAVIRLEQYEFTLPLLYSPGFWLFLTCIFSALIFRVSKGNIASSVSNTFKQWIPFTITTTSFVSMSEIMSRAGMIDTLAALTASVFGSGFLFLIPLIGGLGGFLTGSNTGSNAMFMHLQVQTAKSISMNPQLAAALQNISSSHTTMTCPSRVMLASSLCEIRDRENEILKHMGLITVGVLIIIIMSGIIFRLA